MMGKPKRMEPKLFYASVNLADRVPDDHPLRRIKQMIPFETVRSRVAGRYDHKRCRWRRRWRWRVKIQCYLVATVQNIGKLLRHGRWPRPAVSGSIEVLSLIRGLGVGFSGIFHQLGREMSCLWGRTSSRTADNSFLLLNPFGQQPRAQPMNLPTSGQSYVSCGSSRPHRQQRRP